MNVSGSKASACSNWRAARLPARWFPSKRRCVFEEAIELEHPILLLEPLAFLLNRLLEQLCARLGSRALATQELRLTLDSLN